MLGKLNSRHVTLLGILASVSCLAYFYMLDRVVFSSRLFVPIFALLLTVYDVRTAWLTVLVCIVAALWKRSEPVLKMIDFLAEHPSKMAILYALMLAIGALGVYHNDAFSMDEYAAVFQSKVFAAGHIYAHVPAGLIDWLVVPGFNGSFLFASRLTGYVIEGYQPGFALLLAAFEFLHAPWLCNPVLSGIAVYLIYMISVALSQDRRVGGWAMLFAISSSSLAAYGISYYSMQAHLVANLAFAYLLIAPTQRRAFCAGLIGSLALILHNPFPHALFAAPWVIYLIFDGRKRGYVFPLIAGYIPGVCAAIGWFALRAWILPVTHSVGGVTGVGGGVFVFPDMDTLNLRAASTAKMLLWGSPCIFLFAIIGLSRSRSLDGVRLLGASAATTFLGYFCVQLDQGHGWGYRYFHSAYGAIPVLAAMAMRPRGGAMFDGLVPFAGAATFLGLVVLLPFQMAQIESVVRRHAAQIPALKRPGANIVFIKPTGGFYMGDLIQFDPFLRGGDLLLVSHGDLLDTKLVTTNWPAAKKIGSGPRLAHWFLGTEEMHPGVTLRQSFDEKTHTELREAAP